LKSCRNLKVEIEYDGTNYCGWQIQGKANGSRKSIQEVLEKKLRKILQEETHTIVAGRTDAGVHALAQVANFKTRSKISCLRLLGALSALLPGDISISKVEEAKDDFNARFNAKSKIYRYTILNRIYPSALLRNKVYFCSYPLNLSLMRSEARALLGKHDFKSFQASDYRERNPVKTIKSLKISKKGDLIHIDIEADSFLYNMVRNIAGTLIEIGRGRFGKGSMSKILLAKNRKFAGKTLPACGLCLLKVKY
jgi:tRNA pseudouridine38-40 synthase